MMSLGLLDGRPELFAKIVWKLETFFVYLSPSI